MTNKHAINNSKHSTNNSLLTNFAFTLAETLIVMGIIGVVAALTLPNLNSSTGDKEKVVKVQKIASNLEDALGRAQAVYGPIDEWFVKDSNKKDKNKRAAERITEFMKISKDCGNNATAGCMKANTTVNANSGHVGMYGSPETILDANTYSYITADGTSLAFDYASDSAFAVWIDIDGPNKGGFIVGSDVFPLTFLKDGLSIYSFAEFQYEEEFASWILMHGNMDYAKADASCKCPDGKTILDGVNNTTCK